eukprot:166827-Rhodomonas_salina.1
MRGEINYKTLQSWCTFVLISWFKSLISGCTWTRSSRAESLGPGRGHRWARGPRPGPDRNLGPGQCQRRRHVTAAAISQTRAWYQNPSCVSHGNSGRASDLAPGGMRVTPRPYPGY